jgi:hypothetical protein
LVDFLLKKATSDPDLDSGVVTHPRRSRRYPAQVLNDLDFADVTYMRMKNTQYSDMTLLDKLMTNQIYSYITYLFILHKK